MSFGHSSRRSRKGRSRVIVEVTSSDQQWKEEVMKMLNEIRDLLSIGVLTEEDERLLEQARAEKERNDTR